jgi:hypothetical protein
VHASSMFAGAPVPPTKNPHSSRGLHPECAQFVSNFMRDKSVVENVEATFVSAGKLKF